MTVSFLNYINQSNRYPVTIEVNSKATQKKILKEIAAATKWSEDEVESLYEEFKQFDQINLATIQQKENITLIPHHLADRHQAVIFDEDDLKCHVAMVDPSQYEQIEEISLAIQKPLITYLASHNDIRTLTQSLYRNTADIHNLSADDHYVSDTKNIEVAQFKFHQLDTEQNLDKLVYHVLTEAIRLQATDIHIELNQDHFLVSYRIMQELSEPILLNAKHAYAFRQKLILLSNGLITQTHKPQDLSFTFTHQNPVFCRLSILPTIGGYSIVIRLFKEFDESFFKVEHLIDDKAVHNTIKGLNSASSALILISGPVNSGKTSLLYSSLIEQVSKNKTIISIEDPVEVRLKGINQIEINPDVDGLSYSSIIKSSARQNPDIVSFGEIREKDVANLAINTASTGVLAYATIHASSCIHAITRLLDLDVKTHMLINTLKHIFSQRLFQKLCSKCSKPYQPTQKELKYLSSYSSHIKSHTYYVKKGCALCQFKGKSGLTVVIEDLTLSIPLKKAIQSHDFVLFNELAIKQIKTSSLPYRGILAASRRLIDFHDLLSLIANYEV